jgi:hypothetical protein
MGIQHSVNLIFSFSFPVPIFVVWLLFAVTHCWEEAVGPFHHATSSRPLAEKLARLEKPLIPHSSESRYENGNVTL